MEKGPGRYLVAVLKFKSTNLGIRTDISSLLP